MFSSIGAIQSVQLEHSCSRGGGIVSRDDLVLSCCDALEAVNQPSRDCGYVAAKTLRPLSLASVLRLAANQQVAELVADTSKYTVL